MTNKYLEKVAFNASSFFKSVKTNHPSALKGGTIGAGIGGAIGAMPTEKLDSKGKYVKKTTGERVSSSLQGALAGGVYGAATGSMRDTLSKARKDAEKAYRAGTGTGAGGSYSKNQGGGNSRAGSFFDDLKDVEKDLGFPKEGFKTKAEATSHYRRTAMKNHPDRGGSVENMQKINAAWDKYKNHPRGFDKLARLLSK